MRVEDVLDNIKLNAGLDDYVVIMDSTINTEDTILKSMFFHETCLNANNSRGSAISAAPAVFISRY